MPRRAAEGARDDDAGRNLCGAGVLQQGASHLSRGARPGAREQGSEGNGGEARVLMNSTEAERDKAFREDVLTISLSDISEDARFEHGGSRRRRFGDARRRDGAGPAREAVSAKESRADAADGAARGGERAAGAAQRARREGPRRSPADRSRRSDMEHFRDWLKRLRGQVVRPSERDLAEKSGSWLTRAISGTA